tara:strand:+ start:182 stop:1993 length:1812 start_codon:yes stop_codon:yes gene_type:complete
MLSTIFLLPTLVLSSSIAPTLGNEPNPPTWPDSVRIFDPSDTDINATVYAAFATNGGHTPSNHGQFSTSRFAFFFKPGIYSTDVPVGYYTQILGLGQSPDDVVFTSQRGVFSPEGDFTIGGALSSFWRSAENFKTMANYKWYVGTGMMWAVSQAAPLRRIEVENDLLFFQYEPPIPSAGEASGGFFANLKVNGQTKLGSQQQWYARDSFLSKWVGGVWNIVTTGVIGAPPTKCDNANNTTPSTNVPTTPLMSEKPFITIDAAGKFNLQIPPVVENQQGNTFDTKGYTTVGFEKVYVTQLTDTAELINSKLNQGLHIVFSPGIYEISAPLAITHPGTIVLGLGLATLVASDQTATIFQIGPIDGVRICGVLLQAGATKQSKPPHVPVPGSTLINWGTSTTPYAGNRKNPGFLHDVFFRVGGPDGTNDSPVAVDTMLHIHNGFVIGDNMWLWRADHAANAPVDYSSNRCNHGLVVDGDDVTMHGLAVEHTEQDLTQWNGERGATYFYQSELPYVVTQAEFENSVGYRVGSKVSTHHGYGIGVYCFFKSHQVNVTSGIVTPPMSATMAFHNSLSVFLNGYGGIEHVLNRQGGASVKGGDNMVHYVC